MNSAQEERVLHAIRAAEIFLVDDVAANFPGANFLAGFACRQRVENIGPALQKRLGQPRNAGEVDLRQKC